MQALPRELRGPSPLRRRALGALMLAGGVFAGITVALPPAATGSDELVLGCGALATITGIALLLSRTPVRESIMGAAVALGTLLVTVATSEGGPASTGTGDNEMLYVWVCLFSFYFFSVPHALLQLGFVALAYAWLLHREGVVLNAAATQWLITLGTLLVAGLLVARLRTWLQRLVRELTDRARIDSLTGLLNRNALEERAELEFARSRRNGHPISLLVVDVDDFKAINDTLGHPAGDGVLRRVAAALESETRVSDAVSRVGGDEFAVLMPGVERGAVTDTAERLLRAVQAAGVEAGASLTISVGVAVESGGGGSLQTLWSAADIAMYQAKRGGGDAVAESAPQLAPLTI